jgi:hypothetical protein
MEEAMTAKSRIVRSGGIDRRGRSEEEGKEKIELSLELKDFGPLTGGRITLKPLTLFIGPNSSGKSYAAMLIHSIFYPSITLAEHVPFLKHS